MRFITKNYLTFLKDIFAKCKNKYLKKNIIIPFFIISIVLIISFVNSSAFKNNQQVKLYTENISTEYNLKLTYFSEIIGDENIAKITLDYAKANNIKPELVIAIMKVESEFNPYAKNHNKNGSIDRGLLQLNNKTFSDLTSDEFFQPEVNIKKGVEFLEWCLKKSDNNLVKALAYYNVGFGKVSNKKVGEATLDYINKVITELQHIEDGFVKYKPNS